MIIILSVIGILLISNGIFMVIIYSNYLTLGYNLPEFVYFIIRRPSSIGLILGVYILYKVVRKESKNELLFRRKAKFSRKLL